ncbi:hypothetical protein E2C01_067983 [Portunus trituberculatus]|uniref:Uncharacterized protein n=1 Tax=Portunus trituberculatus TaxID=210409 RepID=A0A5B7HWP4_PORTR|nr:hypothetical protein [Portunus trituberculatus]
MLCPFAYQVACPRPFHGLPPMFFRPLGAQSQPTPLHPTKPTVLCQRDARTSPPLEVCASPLRLASPLLE